jgi:hypothetical protein
MVFRRRRARSDDIVDDDDVPAGGSRPLIASTGSRLTPAGPCLCWPGCSTPFSVPSSSSTSA